MARFRNGRLESLRLDEGPVLQVARKTARADQRNSPKLSLSRAEPNLDVACFACRVRTKGDCQARCAGWCWNRPILCTGSKYLLKCMPFLGLALVELRKVKLEDL